ncbi:MAG: hypothetical protein KAR01_00360 [Desulfocapsa sp.]|nr:hypothetical protein [Desulfocapsa sp.]
MKYLRVPYSRALAGWTCKLIAILMVTVFPLTAGANNLPNPTTDLRENWGIEVLGIRSTAAGYMLDFRYRVLDAEKANPLFRRKSRPQLIDQESGAHVGVFSSPKTGPMRTTNVPQAGRNYFILFANPGRYIQPGNRVTISIDDFKVENLVVQ